MIRADFRKLALKVVEINLQYKNNAFPEFFKKHLLDVLNTYPNFDESKWQSFISNRLKEKGIFKY